MQSKSHATLSSSNRSSASASASDASLLSSLPTVKRDGPWQISRDLLVVVDVDGKIHDSNPAWLHILGWHAEEIVARHLDDFVHPDDASSGAAALREPAPDGIGFHFENRMKTKRGQFRRLRWDGIWSEGLVCLAGRDITIEREREMTLEDSRDFARLALSAVSGVGVWTYDVPTDRFFCDEAISALYAIDAGQGAAGISREGFLANVHPDDRKALRATMGGGLIRSGDLELEYRICHPDGSVKHVLSRGHTYFNEDAVPVRRTGVGIDMTAQRELEQQLRQSQKMEAVGMLTGGIAHDFNNMLQGVTGPLELVQHLMQRGETAKIGRYIEMSIASARRAAALTHRLLAFSRRQPLMSTSIDVRRLVSSLEDLIRHSAKENIEIRLGADTEPCQVRCDANQLESALLNLTINACDAMPHGGTLTVSAARATVSQADASRHPDARAGCFICIAVSDTGTGMSKRVLDQVFAPFFTTKPLGQGTGLGLSMVHGFVGQSGGFVTIETELDVGTAVKLYLPEDDSAADSAPASRAVSGAVDRGAGETILIVDDDETIRQLLADIFEDAGYQTALAHDGPTGLAYLLSAAPIALLITDIGLPGLNGKQIAEAARAHRPELPILFTTGYAEAAMAGNILLEKMDLVTKPFTLHTILERTRSLLTA